MASKIDALRGLDEKKEALELANSALARIPRGDLYPHYYQILTSRGQIFHDEGDIPRAIADYQAALQDATRIDYWRGVSEVGGYLARAFEENGQLKDALAAVDQAIDANKRIPDELYFLPRNLALKADITQKLGHPKQATVLYKQSTTLIDAMLAHAPTDNVERILLAELSDVYCSCFASRIQQNDYNNALAVIEEVRGRIEAQALLHHVYSRPHDPSPTDRQLTALNLKLIDTEEPRERDRILREIYDTELHLSTDSLEEETATQPVTLNSLQHILKPDELFIEYVLASPKSYVLAVTNTTVRAYPLADRKKIELDAGAYRGSLQIRKADASAAARLYDSLLAPISEVPTHESLIVVPDGALHLIPFKALIHHDHYVIETHTVTLVPSGTVLALLTERRQKPQVLPLPYVGVAAWIRPQQSPRNVILRAISGPEKDEFTPLPESKREVETIADDLPRPSMLLLGSDATETRFKSLPLLQVDVLHPALHGYIDTEYPDRSALVFAPGGTDDGLLQVREIRRLHLNASLVTLSACNTAVGPVGEAGVANIDNAFIQAGADSVVSTLWELEDHTSEMLMTDFYAHLASNETKSEALRHAQLDLLAQHLPPYYWASFELVGEPNGTIVNTAKQPIEGNPGL